jgi:transcriptional regulator with XRE-family HTH domain
MSDRADEDARGPDPLAALGAAIRTLRTRADLSQEELAQRAELEASALAAFEAGQVEPTWGDLRRLASALGTPLERLLEAAEELEWGDDSASKP